jgi:hypothetical protein
VVSASVRLAGQYARLFFTGKLMQQVQLPPLAEGEIYLGGFVNATGDVTHTILLPGDVDDVSWSAAKEWAVEQGGELPTRREQSLLFANLKGEFEERAYWSTEAHESESGWAWYQDFDRGGQYCYRQTSEFRARAVRRLSI